MMFNPDALVRTSITARCRSLVQLLDLLGIVMLSLGSALGTALVNGGLLFLLISLALRMPAQWPVFRREPLFWLSIILMLYLAAEMLWLSRGHASEIVDPGRGLKDLLAISGLTTILVAGGLAGSLHRMVLAAVLAIASLLLAVASHSGPQAVASYLAGERANFGLGGNGPGVYLSLAVLALLCLSPRAVAWLGPSRRGLRWVGGAGALLIVAIFVLAVIFNQSRSSWLAALIVFPVPVSLIIWRRYRRLSVPARRQSLLVGTLIGIPLLTLVLLAGTEVAEKRLADDRDAIGQLAQLQFDDVAPGSIGIRLRLWEYAGTQFAERPLFGHGPGTSRMLIEEIPGIATYPHFHNLYLQLLVETGVVGLLLFAAVFAALVMAVWRSRRAGLLPWEAGLFFAAAAVFFLIVSLVQIRHDDTHGMAFFALLTGLAYTRWLHRPIGSPST